MHLHTLKGITATLGASRVSKYAAELEHRTKPSNAPSFCIDEQDAEALRRLLAQDQEELLAAFERVEVKTELRGMPSHELLTQQAVAERLQSVLPLLQQSRMEALVEFQALLDECSDAQRQELAKLSDEIQQLQFAKAEVTLHRLLQGWETMARA